MKIGMCCVENLDASQLATSINGMLEEIPNAKLMAVSTDEDASTWILAYSIGKLDEYTANLLVRAGHIMGDIDVNESYEMSQLQDEYELHGVECITGLPDSQALVAISGVAYKIVWR